MITLPAGKYLIGDLCYRSPDVWDQMISGKFQNGMMSGRAHNSYDGTDHLYVILNTKYGDGAYEDSDRDVYYVDSGTIGIMSWDKGTEYDSPMGRTVYFPHEFQVYEDNGKLHFGSLVIDTDPEPLTDAELDAREYA